MFSKIVEMLLRRGPGSSPPSLSESERRAAHNYLGKQAKLETAADAVVVRQVAEIADDEVETVKRYREWKVFRKGEGSAPTPGSPGKGKDKMGDFIVCDNYQKGVSPLALAAVALGALAVTGLGGWGVAAIASRLASPPVVQAVEDTDTTRRSVVDTYNPRVPGQD